MQIGDGTDILRYSGKFPQAVDNAANKGGESEKVKELDKLECQTCKNRRYVDGSDDPGVSFKTPTKIDAKISAIKVYAHEREHYSRENAKAARDKREVVSNTIRLFQAVCPECGSFYVSGGETRTVTKGEKNGFNAEENEENKFRPIDVYV